MAYNFLTLTNDVCKRLNETNLTSSNFSTAVGHYGVIKDSINYALRDINQYAYEWPFNYSVYTETLVAGTSRYSFQSDFKTCSMDTFRVKRSASFGNDTRLLQEKSYEEYLSSYIDQEYNTTDTSIRGIPRFVFKTPNLEYVLTPAPDEAYDLVYEYYTIPVDLDAYSDAPTVPFQFRKVISDGAMLYNYMFRGDVENSQIVKAQFDSGIKQMRSLYINRYSSVKSTMINQGRRSNVLNERVG